jgi:flagellar hook protein FlgE
MLASLFAGVAGLRNHQVRMNVIGNNISNINTIGFKSGRSIFREALVQTLRGAGRPSSISGGTNPVQLGLGMEVASIDNLFTQGGLELTGQITDLAIQGNGFFLLSDGNSKFYSRAGAFGFDANSYLVNPSNGLFVQGKTADSTGTIPATAIVGNIKLPFGQQDPARNTSRVDFGNNLDASVTRSEAAITAGTTATNGITSVTGAARDGAGGVHVITITGAQATEASRAGSYITATSPKPPLTGSETLTTLGVTLATLSVSVDGGAPVDITGLTTSSTVNDVIAAIDIIDGIDAKLDSGEIKITRTKAGVSYTVESNTAVAGDIANRLFGVAAAAIFQVNNGTNHSFVATDVFTPPSYVNGTAVTTNLGITVNDNTGLATGVTGLAGGGITVNSADTGLLAGTASITTKDTDKATSITVFDSLGGTHVMMTNFIKSHEPNKWYWNITMQGGEIIQSGATGTVTFNSDGSLLRFNIDGGADKFSFDPNNGAGLTQVELFAGSSGKYDGLTGFSGTETVAAVKQNGYGMGILDKISIDPTGLIIGIFSNGVSRNLAQIVLAGFNNQAGLMKSGESLFQSSANSGEGIEGVAGETIAATISSGALESANVDLAQEFTNMIIAQRGFQSNARVITTSDSMLDDLVNLKR